MIIVWRTHAYSINGVMHPTVINNHLKVKCPLCIFFTYVQAVTLQNESRTVRKASLDASNGKYKWCLAPQLRCHAHQLLSLKSEVFNTTILNLLHSNTNQDLVEKYLCNQGSHYENTIMHAKEAIMFNHQIDTSRCL